MQWIFLVCAHWMRAGAKSGFIKLGRYIHGCTMHIYFNGYTWYIHGYTLYIPCVCKWSTYTWYIPCICMVYTENTGSRWDLLSLPDPDGTVNRPIHCCFELESDSDSDSLRCGDGHLRSRPAVGNQSICYIPVCTSMCLYVPSTTGKLVHNVKNGTYQYVLICT